MAPKVFTTSIPHLKAGSYVDEQVDQFDAFGISWNGAEAIHLTFGRNTVNVKTSRFYTEGDSSGIEAGEMEVVRLDVAGLTLPIEVARQLSETLQRMIDLADKRIAKSAGQE